MTKVPEGWHCAQCFNDWNPYVRVGDVIGFWFVGLKHYVEGPVTKVIDHTYVIEHGASYITATHGKDCERVDIIRRPGTKLPTSEAEHIAYARKHLISAPNRPDEFYRAVRAAIREEYARGAQS